MFFQNLNLSKKINIFILKMETDIEIKKSMCKEFENKNNIISVKDKLFGIMKNMKQDDLINSPSFLLEYNVNNSNKSL